ncbi:MAG: TIGR04283 family arsenosugar biosynthesis glycosyltransferase [Verrucomicrobia bacterium]|nr:TIGR04283 family arsenosugar biosynthesis glycosyltransferase [Verrucomicrobiota bacterium]
MISVIIPTLNEAALLPASLRALHPQAVAHEVLVVDAASKDDTVARARAAGARVLESPQTARASQLNLGAQQARGDVLLFPHADTVLPATGLERIMAALDDPRVVGGAFARRFQSDSLVLRATCLLAEWRGRWLGWHLGDQAIFVRRPMFEALAGFREIPLFEDLDFSRRLARRGRVVTLRPPVQSSARRFAARGALRTCCADFWLTCRYLAGVDPKLLAEQRSRGREHAR